MFNMKTFSRHWKSSKNLKKQKKYRYNAPLHIRKNMLAVNLSKELRKLFGRRSIPVHKGDRARIMRGEFKKKSGKVDRVDHKKLMVYIESIEKTKRDGTKVRPGIQPSNIQLVDVVTDDKKRKKLLERTKK